MAPKNDIRWHKSTDRKRDLARARLGVPIGQADAELLLDNQPNESNPAIELLTVAEAAKFLKISKSGIRRLQHGRHVPFFKIGGSIRFAGNDLLTYLARQRVGSLGK